MPAYPRFPRALRVALLTPELSPRRLLRRIRRCRTIAGRVPFLCDLARAVESGDAALPPIQAAVIAFTGIRYGKLMEPERDLFWRAFQVPVFEVLLSPDGRILAVECDAHDGLHLLDPGAPLTRLRALIDTSPCACGDRRPRIVSATAVVGAPMPADVDDHGDDQEQQVYARSRVS